MPVERALLPEIKVTDQEDGDIEEHLHKAKPLQFTKNESPGVEEDGLDVEENEDHGDEVELDGEGFAGVAGGLHAAFVGLLLGAAGAAPADEAGKTEENSGKNSGQAEEEQQRSVGLKVRGIHGEEV